MELHAPQAFERVQDAGLKSRKSGAVTQPQQKQLQSRLNAPDVMSPNLRSRMSHFNYDGGDVDDDNDDNNDHDIYNDNDNDDDDRGDYNGNHDNTDKHENDDDNAACDTRAADNIDDGNVPAPEKRIQLSSAPQSAAPFRPSMSAFISQRVERGSELRAALAHVQGTSTSVPSSRRAAPFSPRS
jgi:hypothetical protein